MPDATVVTAALSKTRKQQYDQIKSQEVFVIAMKQIMQERIFQSTRSNLGF